MGSHPHPQTPPGSASLRFWGQGACRLTKRDLRPFFNWSARVKADYPLVPVETCWWKRAKSSDLCTALAEPTRCDVAMHTARVRVATHASRWRCDRVATLSTLLGGDRSDFSQRELVSNDQRVVYVHILRPLAIYMSCLQVSQHWRSADATQLSRRYRINQFS